MTIQKLFDPPKVEKEEKKTLKINQLVTLKIYLGAQSCKVDKQLSETQSRNYLIRRPIKCIDM